MTARNILAWSPSAIVFDCDGTLMDTERHWQEARNVTFGLFGLRPPSGFADRAKGVHYTECGALMAEETGKPDLAEDLAATLLTTFTALVDKDPVTMPGAAALVRLAARHLPSQWRATALGRQWKRASNGPDSLSRSATSLSPAREYGRSRSPISTAWPSVCAAYRPRRLWPWRTRSRAWNPPAGRASASSASGPARRVPRPSRPTCGSRASPTGSWWAGPAAESGSRAPWCRAPRSGRGQPVGRR